MKKILFLSIAFAMAFMPAAEAQYYPYYGYPVGAAIGVGIASALVGTAIGGLYTTPYPYYPYSYAPQCWNQVAGYDAWGNQVIQRVCQ